MMFSTGVGSIAKTILNSILYQKLRRKWRERMPVTPQTICERARDAVQSGSVIAQLRGVSKNYADIQALHHLELSIRSRELLALLGPNGAGKTTAVKLLLGLARPTNGTVTVFGGDPTRSGVRVRIGAMLQVARVPATLRVREHIDLFSSYYPHPLPMNDTLVLAGLMEVKDRFFGELSGGQQQKVLLALAICGNPDLLFLDEPTVGLDVEARRRFWQLIRSLIDRGKTVLLTTHYLEEADALADQVVVINKGAVIAQGTPAEIKALSCDKKIRCATRLELDLIRELPGVDRVKMDREVVEIQSAQVELVLRELLARDPGLSGIEVTSAGLEEAFLTLTRE
jgi:ABC-2 type transport system ATP-binding protein